jgi:hypothetical protein
MRKNLLFVAILAISIVDFAEAQGVYFNGLGRAIVTNDNLSGLALDPDSIGSTRDSQNDRKGTGGYTLFDLGINAQPSENLRANAILRVRNEFGGFYGDGSFLEFRQLRLDGILNKVVKYEIGDIDLSMTPYTLYNFSEMYHDYEADIFAIRRSIVQYENFNFGNKWRVQGFNANTALKFEKGIEKLAISAFATRTRTTNFANLPDRLLVGGDVKVVQSKFLKAGFNYVKFFDVVNTAPASSIQDFDNDVMTGDFTLNYEVAEKVGLSLYGEFGGSRFKYDTAGTAVSNNDNFYDLGVSAKYLPLGIKVFANYRNVGAYFSSPSAQTRRIYDNGLVSLFPTLGNNISYDRQPILYDRITEEAIRNQTIQAGLMSYLPQYNAITPYGIATPNRKGITAGVSAGGDDKIYSADVIVDMLNEVSGEGTSTGDNKRSFFGAKGGASISVNKIIGFEKALVLSGGFRYEKVERAVNSIDFSSTHLDAGLTIEVYKQLDLLAGYKSLSAKGNEFISVRDAYNLIVGYQAFNIDTQQDILSFGMRYRFSKNTFFTLQGLWVNYDDKASKLNNYEINQAFLSYTMVF